MIGILSLIQAIASMDTATLWKDSRLLSGDFVHKCHSVSLEHSRSGTRGACRLHDAVHHAPHSCDSIYVKTGTSLAPEELDEFYSCWVFMSLSTVGWCLMDLNIVAPKLWIIQMWLKNIKW
jgi:hypothetical protein